MPPFGTPLPFRQCFFALGCALMLFQGLPQAEAQPEPIPRVLLRICQLDDSDLPDFYYMEAEWNMRALERRPEPVEAAMFSRGPEVQIPLLPPVKLFALRPGTELSEANLLPVLTIPAELQQPGQRILLLFYRTMNGEMKHRFLDESAAQHPPGHLRFLNTFSSPVALSAGGAPVIVPGAQESLLRPELDERGRFPFKCVFRENASIFERLHPDYYRLRPSDARVLMVYAARGLEQTRRAANSSEATLTVKYEPYAFRLFDRIDAPTMALPTSTSPSQRPDSPPSASSPAGQIHLTVLDPNNRTDGTGAVRVADADGNGLGEISIQGRIGQGDIPLSSPADIQLFTRNQAIGTIPVPDASATDFLAVLASAQATHHMLVFDNSLQSHPRGQIRIVNLTPFQVAFSTSQDRTVLRISPKGDSLVQLEGNAQRYPLKIAVQALDGWEMVQESEIARPAPHARRVIVVFDDPESGEFFLLDKTL